MADNREGSLKLHLVHGGKNHFVTLTPSMDEDDNVNDVLAIRHLTAATHELTGVPPERQKLIFKGKSLTQNGDPNQSLSSIGLRPGSRVMVLGSKEEVVTRSVSDHAQNTRCSVPATPSQQADDRRNSDLQKLDSMEKRISAEETTLSAMLEQGQRLVGYTVEESCDPEQLEKLKKGLMTAEEKLMRLLESLDTFRFEPSDHEARSKRKALVNRIQRQMDNCEEMVSHIKRTLAVTSGPK